MDYDLVIIGAGWAGFNAAIKARESGLKAALIEKSNIGGTCLNSGCIPTKTLIQSAKIYSLTKKANIFGIESASSTINFNKIQERKEKIIQGFGSGMQFMLKGVDFIYAEAEIISKNEIKIRDRILTTKYMLIACGSKPIELKDIPFNGKNIISSTEILSLKEIPASLLIVGGGVIGCEFASLFSTLGSAVTIIEKMPQLLPGEDKEIARSMENTFKKKGIKVSTNTDAATLNPNDFNFVLVCVGRTPDTERLGLQNIGVKLERNKIVVDEYLKTNIPNIFAAGDSTGKMMLAHFAAYQGEIAAENIAHPDKPKKADNQNIPNCIFTEPEIASIGLREDDAKNQGIDVKIYKFDFLASGKARILDEAEGFIKIVSDNKTDILLGASIIGPNATELIATLGLAISCHLTVSQVKNTIFAHPTLSESIREALQ